MLGLLTHHPLESKIALEVLGLLTHHPLESKIAKELFHSMAVSVFRFSAAELLPAHSPSLEQHVTFRGRGG